MKNLFYKVTQNIARCYTGRNLLFQLLAFAATYILVATGFDWTYFQATRGATLQSVLWPAVIVGMLVPVFLPIVLFIVGGAWKKIKITYLACATGQAGLLGFFLSSLYKVFTGRPGPNGFGRQAGQTLSDISHIFRFGIYRGGAFQGWPSSHTTVAFAVSCAIIALYPKSKTIKWVALLYAFYIGIGVSTNIHWFSDFVVGAVLGSIIGLSVGRRFYKKYQEGVRK